MLCSVLRDWPENNLIIWLNCSSKQLWATELGKRIINHSRIYGLDADMSLLGNVIKSSKREAWHSRYILRMILKVFVGLIVSVTALIKTNSLHSICSIYLSKQNYHDYYSSFFVYFLPIFCSILMNFFFNLAISMIITLAVQFHGSYTSLLHTQNMCQTLCISQRMYKMFDRNRRSEWNGYMLHVNKPYSHPQILFPYTLKDIWWKVLR